MKSPLFRYLAAFLVCPMMAIAQTNFTILKSFTGAPDGAMPWNCSLVCDTNGMLYGTSVTGGISNQGTVFVLNHNGVGYNGTGYKVLKSFFGTDGAAPSFGLVLGSDGNLYGTTYYGGTSNFGVVFKMARDGNGFAVLHSFNGGSDSANPGGLTEGSDGALYGTTYYGNSSTRGTFYKINKDGSGYSILHTFTGNPDGQQPSGRPLQGSDGALYGTTSFGGSYNGGVVYSLNKDGSGYSIPHNFSNDTNGYDPVSVIEGSDHVLYGVAAVGGGTGYWGTIFKMNKDGSGYQLLHSFPSPPSDGNPQSGLTEGADGWLYGGTSDNGQSNSSGIIYKLKKDGSAFTVLRSFVFTGGDGDFPLCTLLQLNSGVFYGTTAYGGAAGGGCVFALSISPLPPQILSLSISSATNFLQFSGTSFVEYDVQRSTNLSSWSTLTTSTCQTNGLFNYSDLNPPLPSAFYRLQQH